MLRVKLQNRTDQPWLCDEDLKNLSITGDGRLLLDVQCQPGIFSSRVEIEPAKGYNLNGGVYHIAEVYIDTPNETYTLTELRERARKLKVLKDFDDNDLIDEVRRRGFNVSP